jgi:hypothetical protein
MSHQSWTNVGIESNLFGSTMQIKVNKVQGICQNNECLVTGHMRVLCCSQQSNSLLSITEHHISPVTM